MKDPRKFWNKLAPRYAKSPVRNEKIYQQKLEITQSYFKPDWSVFEFGCGTGSTAIVHSAYVKQILATDISDEMIAIAEQKTQAQGITNISYQRGTIESLALPVDSFDAVLGLNILHLLPNLDETITQVHQILKPGGIFVSSNVLMREVALHWRLLIGFAPQLSLFSKDEIISKLTDAGFSIDHEWQPARASLFIIARKNGN